MIWCLAAWAQDTPPVADPEPLALPVEEVVAPETVDVDVAPGTTEVQVERTGGARVGTAFVSIGLDTDADGTGSAVGLGTTLVAGGDGGLAAGTLSVRHGAEQWVAAVHVPFAGYRTAAGRDTGVGNLRLEGFRRWSAAGAVTLVGAEVHLPTGNTWTYAFDGASHWPGGGVTAVVQRRQPIGPADLIARGALGVHGTRGVDPFPGVSLHAAAAAALDLDLPVTGLGATTELSLAVWDPSPVDLGGWLRFVPTDGLRLRGGLVVPLAAWAGGSPGRKPAGAREVGLQADLALAF
jgi:hypothetical protein